MSAPGDGATVSVSVRVPPADAFEIFTQEIDLWWRRGPAFRIAGKRPGTLAFEPGVGGRLFETVELDAGPRVFVMGTILEWEPPHRLAFEWRGVNFAKDESTRVEVSFRAAGASTLVTVRHTGFAALRDDHPVRHGHAGAAFSRFIGLWWGELATSLREHAAQRGAARG
ncbi:MAG: activator of HSP90 ATPase [Proteobacteria bacterium]|nr:MAG: activator of HSP90 ATPase [Pseudomonadota bacterium]